MSFSFLKKEQEDDFLDEKKQPPSLKEQNLKLSKEDVLKIRAELKRYEEYQEQKRQDAGIQTRQKKKQRKENERNRFLNISIGVLLVLLGVVIYAVLNW